MDPSRCSDGHVPELCQMSLAWEFDGRSTVFSPSVYVPSHILPNYHRLFTVLSSSDWYVIYDLILLRFFEFTYDMGIIYLKVPNPSYWGIHLVRRTLPYLGSCLNVTGSHSEAELGLS